MSVSQSVREVVAHSLTHSVTHSHTFLGQTPLYLCDLIRRPISATSGRPLRSLDHHDLLVPRSRTATAQHRAYASVGTLLWNDLPTITRSVL